MDLADLIVALKPLVGDVVANWTAIADLLEANQSLAEHEVARWYVYKHVDRDAVRRLTTNVDDRERAQAGEIARLVYPLPAAAKLLRQLIKDPVVGVRAVARKGIYQLGINDVALPDTNYDAPDWATADTPRARGAWNPTGWSFGTIVHPTNPDNLSRYGLPAITSHNQLAAELGADADDFPRLMRPGCGPGSAYVEFEVAKATGGVRRIAAPRVELKTIQRAILDRILAHVPVHDACHGFVPGRSVVSNARPHVGAAVIIKMDIADFFPSVHYRRVIGLFRHLGYEARIAETLAGLTTYRATLSGDRVAWPGRLPQGAPTSPAIANLVCRRMDARLAKLAERIGARYTRYADDMTFSFAAEPTAPVGRLMWWVDQICGQEGFVENVTKRRVMRPSGQQRVTGIVVNSGLHVPRQARRRFRAILHNCRQHGVASQAGDHADFPAYLRGFAAYVHMVQPALGIQLRAEVEAVLGANP